MTTRHKGLTLVGSRWCSSEELDRLRREAEANGPKSEARYIRARQRCGKPLYKGYDAERITRRILQVLEGDRRFEGQPKFRNLTSAWAKSTFPDLVKTAKEAVEIAKRVIIYVPNWTYEVRDSSHVIGGRKKDREPIIEFVPIIPEELLYPPPGLDPEELKEFDRMTHSARLQNYWIEDDVFEDLGVIGSFLEETWRHTPMSDFLIDTDEDDLEPRLVIIPFGWYGESA